MCLRRCRTRLPLLLTAFAGTFGCASSGAVPRPIAFPGAPPPPAVFRSAAVERTRLPDAEDLIRAAARLQGIRYRLGGETPADGFDCSGFVRYVYGLHHLSLPRTVTQQYAFGTHVAEEAVREGDLVFFSTTAPGPSHVGIAAGHGEFIHAPGASGTVRVERLDAPYWHNRMIGVRRVL